jgi:hypothetical protein
MKLIFGAWIEFGLTSSNQMVPNRLAMQIKRHFEMYDDNKNVIQQMVCGGQDLTPFICLKKMRFIFIKFAKCL